MHSFRCFHRTLILASLLFSCSVLQAQEGLEDEAPAPDALINPLTNSPPKSDLEKSQRKKSSSPEPRKSNRGSLLPYMNDMYVSRQSLVFDVRRDRIMHEPVEVLDPTTGKWEVDFLFLHLGASVAIDQDIQLDGRRLEAYIPSIDGGVRVHLPLKYVQPFVGAGYTIGWVAVSEPNNRGSHDITVLWQGSRSGIWGFYGELGADFLVPVARRAGLGLRTYLRYGSLESESIPDFGGRQIASTKWTPFIGIVFAH